MNEWLLLTQLKLLASSDSFVNKILLPFKNQTAFHWL